MSVLEGFKAYSLDRVIINSTFVFPINSEREREREREREIKREREREREKERERERERENSYSSATPFSAASM